MSEILKDDIKISNEMLVWLSDFVRNFTGLHFAENNLFSLKVAIIERMKANYILDVDKYVSLVSSDSAEKDELISMLTVNETYFFRNKKHFDSLDSILRDLVAKKKNEQGGLRPKIKIVSCGCSAGEEPYSIAIVLLKSRLIDSADFEINAFDIDKKVINRAECGVYNKYSFREHDTEFLNDFFIEENDKFHLKSEVKAMVKFHSANIFDMQSNIFLVDNADIIFFRNVYIYFTQEDVKRCLDFLESRISENAYLFLGASESLFSKNTNFITDSNHGAFIWKLDKTFKKTQDIKFVEPVKIEKSLPVIKKEPIALEEVDKRVHFDNAVGYTTIKLFDKAEIEFKAQLEITPDDIPALKALAQLYVDSDKYDLSESIVNRVIKLDNLCDESYFILGLISYKLNEIDDAIIQFKKTIYCNNSNFTAYYYLGLSFKQQGNIDKANNNFRSAALIIEGMGEEGFNTEYGGMKGGYLFSLCIDNVII